MTVRSRDRSRLLTVSPEMVLATNAVLHLCGKGDRGETVEGLASALRASPPKLQDALKGLAREGIVEVRAQGGRIVCLSGAAAGLTLADIAAAAGDWLLAARRQEDSRASYPGLDGALAMVRERVLCALRDMQVSALAGWVS